MPDEQEQWLAENSDRVAALIEHGFAQAERGDLIDGDELVELLRKRGTDDQQHESFLNRQKT
jgi:hypothetical protein